MTRHKHETLQVNDYFATYPSEKKINLRSVCVFGGLEIKFNYKSEVS